MKKKIKKEIKWIALVIVILLIMTIRPEIMQDENKDTTKNIAIITKRYNQFDPLYVYRIELEKYINDINKAEIKYNVVYISGNSWNDGVLYSSFEDQKNKIKNSIANGLDILILEPFENEDYSFLDEVDIDIIYINHKDKDNINKYPTLNTNADKIRQEQLDYGLSFKNETKVYVGTTQPKDDYIYIKISKDSKKLEEECKKIIKEYSNDVIVCENDEIAYTLYKLLKDAKIQPIKIIGYGGNPTIESLAKNKLVLASFGFDNDRLVGETIDFIYEKTKK